MRSLNLSVKLFQQDRHSYIAMKCEIEGVKSGYLFTPFLFTLPDKALWKGIHITLDVLLKTYQSRHLKIFISPLLFSLDGRITKQKVISQLHFFHSYTIEEISPETEEELDRIFQKGLKDKHIDNKIYGYPDSDLPEEPTEERKSTIYRYYEGFGQPTSGIVLDFETTCAIKNWARPIQVAAIKFRDGEIIRRFHSYIHPNMKVPKKIIELTGITNEMLENAPKAYPVIRDLLKFMEGETLLVGHNHMFDYGLLQELCCKFYLPCPEMELLCTKRLAIEKQVNLSNYKLETLAFLFKISHQPHRADTDCEATYQLMERLYAIPSII